MAISVVINRQIKQGRQAKDLIPILLQMRALAMYQPGYISGETVCDIERPGDWQNWANSKKRAGIEKKIETLTGLKSDYHIYSPMVPEKSTNKTHKKHAECIIAC